MNDTLPKLPRRAPDAHKGSSGRVLVVAGSVGYSGAAFLAAKSALRTGAGIVVTACPESVYSILATKHTAVMVRPFPATPGGSLALAALEPIVELASEFDAVIVGPGLSRDDVTLEVARRLVIRLEKKIVLDADGLNAFEGRTERLREIRGELVLTPHPGELSRLLGTSSAAIQKDREGSLRQLLEKEKRGVLVLKGKGTLVGELTESGVRIFENRTGNPGMATAGAGDVLSGIIGALLAAGLSAWDAARLGVHLHGLAGDLGVQAVGTGKTPVPLTATDILDQIQAAFATQLLAEGAAT